MPASKAPRAASQNNPPFSLVTMNIMIRTAPAVDQLSQLISEAEKLYPKDGRRYAGPLALSAKNGDIPAAILFIGEAPGRLGAGSTGIPFFTRQNEQSANRFAALMATLGADCDGENGWRGHGVFVTDVVLRNPVQQGARGLKNRPLTRNEVKASLELLRRQIALVRPRIIVALGKKACRALSMLFDCEPTIDGCVHEVEGESFRLVGWLVPSNRQRPRRWAIGRMPR